MADVDECSEGSDDCDINANCFNQIGSFDCICKEHYFGPGFACLGIFFFFFFFTFSTSLISSLFFFFFIAISKPIFSPSTFSVDATWDLIPGATAYQIEVQNSDNVNSTFFLTLNFSFFLSFFLSFFFFLT